MDARGKQSPHHRSVVGRNDAHFVPPRFLRTPNVGDLCRRATHCRDVPIAGVGRANQASDQSRFNMVSQRPITCARCRGYLNVHACPVADYSGYP
jgi:hypothetical protein